MSELLTPKTLLAIKDLQLAAKTTIKGFMQGINKGTIRGEGLEFSQYRSYQPGDDLRQLDWKVYARSDRYYIRESEIETSINVRLVVDASNSMNHNDDGYAKIDYARYLAASLGWLAALQGDAVGLYVLQEAGLTELSPKRGYQQMTRFYHTLEQIVPSGRNVPASQYKSVLTAGAARELVIFISDLYQQQSEILDVLESLALMKHEILIFHLMGKNELEFAYEGFAALEDLETGRRIKINPRRDQAEYLQQLNAYLSSVRLNMLNRHFFYRLFNTRQPVEQALRDFLKQRAKLSI